MSYFKTIIAHNHDNFISYKPCFFRKLLIIRYKHILAYLLE